jgi:hypothetical protein
MARKPAAKGPASGQLASTLGEVGEVWDRIVATLVDLKTAPK